jgi:signal transduction histidine kinase
MKYFRSVWSKPYDLYRRPRHRMIFASFFAGFTWFMLFVFGVFDFDYFSTFKRLYITGIYALACWSASIFNLFVVQRILIKKYTFGNAVILSISIMVTIGIFNYLLTTLFFQWEPFTLKVFLKNQLYTFAIGLIIAPFVVLAHYSYQMRRRSGRQPEAALYIPETTILLESEYKQGNLELEERDLLFIRTADNYIDVYYLAGNSIRHRLLRSTLSAVEKAIKSPLVLRCHRSYIVNLYHTSSSGRNVSELKLPLNGKEFLIPVSRKHTGHIRTILKHHG